MAGPTLEQWISDLGLQQVNDPDVDKPVYRMSALDGRITLSAALEENICTSIREARERRNLSRSKLAPLLGLSEAVYARYETSVSRLTVGRLIHLCEVLGASPEEILAPAALHLWGENQGKVDLLLACFDKLRGFDEETLQDVFSLLKRLGETGKSGHGSGGAASAAPLLSRAADPSKRVIGHGEPESRRLMLESEIPAFVEEVIKAGCDICAIGHDCYVLATSRKWTRATAELQRLGEKFGDRDFLLLEIVAYLRSIGRYLDPGSPAKHWTKNGNIH